MFSLVGSSSPFISFLSLLLICIYSLLLSIFISFFFPKWSVIQSQLPWKKWRVFFSDWLWDFAADLEMKCKLNEASTAASTPPYMIPTVAVRGMTTQLVKEMYLILVYYCCFTRSNLLLIIWGTGTVSILVLCPSPFKEDNCMPNYSVHRKEWRKFICKSKCCSNFAQTQSCLCCAQPLGEAKPGVQGGREQWLMSWGGAWPHLQWAWDLWAWN